MSFNLSSWLKNLVLLLSLLGAASLPRFAVAVEKSAVIESANQQYFEFKEPGLEFTIKVPPQWLVEAGSAGYAAVLRPSPSAPRAKLPGGLRADPKLTIAASKKPIRFDAESLEQTAKEIEERFILVNGSGTDFQVFQKNLLDDLPEGQKGFLYYVSYKTEGAEVGQAILITGSESGRFRVTLSDHRLNFDKNLELYYPYMTSLRFQKSGSSAQNGLFRLDGSLLLWASGVLLAGVILGLRARIRRTHESTIKSRHNKLNRKSKAQSDDLSAAPSTEVSVSPMTSISVSEFASAAPSSLASSAREGSEYPLSEISIAEQVKSNSREEVEPVFSLSDLSSPPQSIPLSQLVDENSAPPDLKKQWKISQFDEKKGSERESESRKKNQ
ncbi:hypothetical protein EBU99_01265 [bacterium]|nr:hypothetical protein [bacterium]